MGPRADAQASLTVFVTTIGRPCLEVCVESFVTQASRDDRMVVFGDGWSDTRRTKKFIRPPAKFMRKKHAGWWGYKHISDAVEAGIETDYWMAIGDDDAFLPTSLAYLRQSLVGPIVIAKALFVKKNRQAYVIPAFTRGARSGNLLAANWQTFYHKSTKVPRLEGISDAQAFREAVGSIGGFSNVTILDKAPLVTKFPRLSQAWWNSLKFDRIKPWSEDFASCLTEESGIELND